MLKRGLAFCQPFSDLGESWLSQSEKGCVCVTFCVPNMMINRTESGGMFSCGLRVSTQNLIISSQQCLSQVYTGLLGVTSLWIIKGVDEILSNRLP